MAGATAVHERKKWLASAEHISMSQRSLVVHLLAIDCPALFRAMLHAA